jgi:tol-pal system protein YbgF
MTRTLTAVCWVLPVVLLGGCADFGGKKALSPTEIRLQAAEAKLAEISRRFESLNQVILDSGANRVEDDVRGLRGDVEKLRFDLEGQDRRGRDLYQDLDKRLARLETGAPVTVAAGAPLVGAAPTSDQMAPVRANPAPTAAPQEEALYLQAFDLLKAGKYDDAIRSFKMIVQTWPDGQYADNAWYWMGEAYYVKREYAAAIQSFQTVPERFPRSPKAADALLKLGLAYGENKQRDQARSAFQRVLKDYPASNAANLARQRLSQP